MKNQIGGLFETQEVANRAYQALQEIGFAGRDISMLVQRPRNKTIRATNVRVQDIAKNALIGGLILGVLGAFIGFLIGTGRLGIPYLEAGRVDNNSAFLAVSIFSGLVGGGLTGIILGVASKLMRSQEKAEVVTRKIKQGGVLVTVNTTDAQTASRARHVLEEHQALEVGTPEEKWDLNAWINPNEGNQSLANPR